MRTVAFAAILGAACLHVIAPAVAQTDADYVPDQVILKFRDGTTPNEQQEVLTQLASTYTQRFERIDAQLATISSMSVEDAVANYTDHPVIEFIEPNYLVDVYADPDDPLFDQLWGMRNTGQTGGTPGADISATIAWDIVTGTQDVVIGVIDTGVNYLHPDLADNIYANPGEIPGNGIDDDGNGFVDDVRGWDFLNEDNDPMDDNSHGSHVSGTIGAVGDNGLGVVGVNWSVRIMPLKFLSAGGSGTTADAIQCVEYSTMMGVHLTNNSWGGGGFSQALELAIEDAGNAGILFVAAAGNDAANNDVSPHYPSSYDLDNIVSVANTDHNDLLWPTSNWGLTSVDLGAPGTAILSTVLGAGYTQKTGTSMASPHVAGALGLIYDRFPAISGADAKNLLLASVDPLPSLAGRVVTGGRLNAFTPILEPDSIPPAMISDLGVVETEGTWVRLAWTATGDDGTLGSARRYEVRYSTSLIDSANFDQASLAPGPPAPLPPGQTEEMQVGALAFSTQYHFAVKAFDELGNSSPISNVPNATTLGPPSIAVAPDSLSADLLTGAVATEVLTISNSGAAELNFEISIDQAQDPAAAYRIRTFPASVRSVRAPAAPFATLRSDPYAGEATGRREAYDPRGLRSANVLPGDLRILILQSGGDVSEIRSALSAFPDIALVDVFDGGVVAPTLDDLLPYHTVFVVVNTSFGDAVSVGNVLADYADTGGGVVMTLASFISGWEVQGRFLSDGYFPFELGSGPIGGSSLGTFDPSHPIMQGVSSATGDLLGAVTIAAGAEPVAQWANGQPLVATQGTNVAAVNIYVGGSGFWTGDIPLLLHNAAFWSSNALDWLSSDPEAGVVPSGGSLGVVIEFDATGLNGGDYEGLITVASDDPNTPEVAVPAHLGVTGAPDIDVNPASLDFGPLFIGAALEDTLQVSNPGTDALVVSGVGVDEADFVVDPTGFTLNPGESRALAVRFEPSVAGPISGTLTLSSNDPDEATFAVSLDGVGLVPPDVTVSPASLTEDLFTGESATQSLTLGNVGGSDLFFEIDTEEAAAREGGVTVEVVAGVGGEPQRILARGRPVPLEEIRRAAVVALRREVPGPSSIDRTSGEPRAASGSGGVLRAPEEEVFGNDDNAFFAGPRSRGNIFRCTVSKTLTEHRLYLDPGGSSQLWFLVYEGDAQIGTYDLVSASDVSPAGPGLGWYSSGDVHVEMTENKYYLIIASFESPSTYFNQQAISPYPVPASFGELITGAGWNWSPTSVFPPDLTQSVPSQAFGDPIAYYQTIVTGASVRWLTVAPEAGTIGPSLDLTLDVTFDADGLLGGDYDANIVVLSNDPDEPEVRVPTHLHVTGAPDIAVSEMSLAFGAVFVTGTKSDTLQVTNSGTDLLAVTGVSSDHADFTADVPSFDLAPGDSQTVVVTFAPTAPGLAQANLTFSNNDPDEPELIVTLEGEGIPPPEIAVAPESLSEDLFTGETSTQVVTIQNTGDSDLLFDIFSTEASGAGTIPVRIPGRIGFDRASSTQQPVSTPVDPGPFLSRYGELDSGDSDGDSGTIPNSDGGGSTGQDDDFVVALAGSVVVFHDDMESGVNGWIHYATHPSNEDRWAQTNVRASSGVTSWNVSQHGSPGAEALQSPEIDLTTLSEATLAFQHWWEFDDCGGDPTFEPDGGIVEISTDGGGSWLQIFPMGGYPYVLDDICGNPLAFYEAYSHDGGVGAQFVPAVFDLTPYTGQVISLRFHAGWDCGNCDSNEGWYVDDVTVFSPGVGWLSMEPSSGTVPPLSQLEIAVTFAAAGLNGGDYAADIVIASNDPVEPEVVVAAQLHVTGAPDVALSDTTMSYGTVFVGTTVSDTLIVSNVGTDFLNVSLVDIDHPDYTVDGTPFTLAPGETRSLEVTFGPTGDGPIPGVLSLGSDDPDDPLVTVDLEGNGLFPPLISVSPTSLVSNLLTNETESLAATLHNTGGSDLVFDADLHTADAVTVHEAEHHEKGAEDPRPGILGSGGPDAFGYTWVDSDDPAGPAFDWVDIRGVGTQINMSGDDRNSGALPIGFTFPYYENTYDEFRVCTNGWVSFTSSSTQYSNQPLPSTGAPDNLLALFWDDLYFPTNNAYYHDDGSRLVIQFQEVPHLGGGGPFTMEIVLFPSGRILYQYLDVASPTNSSTIGFQNAARNDGLTIAFNSDYAHDNLAILISTTPPWLDLSPTAGTVPAGGTLPLEVTTDATGLFGGTYEGLIDFVSNDPFTPSLVLPVTLNVTGVPDVAVSPGQLDFGGVFVGGSSTLELQVSNSGTDLLTVTGITSSDADYMATPTVFDLGPFASQTVEVTFAPTTAVPHPAALTLAHNAPSGTTDVPLTGAGLVPPDIAVSPPAFSEDLFSGDVVTRTLTIANTGGSDLDWNLSVLTIAGAPPAAAFSPAVSTAPGSRPGLRAGTESSDSAPEGYEPTPTGPITGGSATVLIIQDVAPWGSNANETLLALHGIEFDMIPVSQLAATNLADYRVVLVPSDQWTSTYSTLASRQAQIEAFVAAGGVLEFHAAGWGWNSGNASLVTLPGGMGIVNGGSSTNHVLEPGHPLMQGVPDPFTGNSASHSHFTNIPPSALHIVEDSAGRTNFVEYTYGSGRVVSGGQTFEFGWDRGEGAGTILANMIPYVHGLAPSWLRVEPRNGVAPAGQSVEVEVTFDATGLLGGDYQAEISIASNDPDEAEVVVPVDMHVTGAPHIVFSDDVVAFGPLFIGLSRSDTVHVSNTGTDLLLVTDVSSDHADFAASPASFSIAPGDSLEVVATFQPTTAGIVEAVLTFTSNDPGNPDAGILLRGEGVVPPDIVLDPPAVAAAALPGGEKIKTLRIHNPGGADLEWAVSSVEVPSPPPAGAFASAGEGVLPSERGPRLRFGPESDTTPPGYAPIFSGPVTAGSATTLIVQDLAPWGSNANETLLTANGVAFDMIPSSHLAATDLSAYRVLLVPGDQTTAFYQTFASRAGQIDDFVAAGGTLEFHAAGWGWHSGNAALVILPGAMHIAYNSSGTNGVLDPGHPLMAGVPDPFTGTQASHARFTAIPPNAIHIAHNGSGRTNLVEYAYGAGRVVTGGQTFEFGYDSGQDAGLILSNMIAYVNDRSPAWLRALPRSGVVPPGQFFDLELTFDAAELTEGDYEAEIVFTTNVPGNPVVSTGAVFHVGSIAATHMRVTPQTINAHSSGNWIKARIELPPGHDPRDVVLSTVRCLGTVSAEEDSVPSASALKIKFDRVTLQSILPEGDDVELVITGEIEDTIWFVGTDSTRVIRPHLDTPNGGEILAAGSPFEITWSEPAGFAVDHADLYYTLDEGQSWGWTPIALGVQGTSWLWSVPSVVSQTARARVYVYDGDGVYAVDTGDEVFELNTHTTGGVVGAALPRSFALHQNAPNPFRPRTQIRFDLPKSSPVELRIYDVSGRLVKVLVDGRSMPGGVHAIPWNGTDGTGDRTVAGVYFYQLHAGDFHATRRMVKLR